MLAHLGRLAGFRFVVVSIVAVGGDVVFGVARQIDQPQPWEIPSNKKGKKKMKNPGEEDVTCE